MPIPGAFILSWRRFGVAAVRVSRACEREEREEEERRAAEVGEIAGTDLVQAREPIGYELNPRAQTRTDADA